MLVKIKALGVASAYLKYDDSRIDLPDGATVGQLLLQLTDSSAQGPEGKDLSLLKGATFLVNMASASRDTVLNDGDEVFIMLRMAGG